MSAFSNYLELKIAQWVTNAVAMGTSPANLYIGLFSSDPTEAGNGGVEVTTTLRGNANRPIIPLTAATDGSGVTTLQNAANFVFVSAASAAATVSHFAIYDTITGNTPGTNNMLFRGQVNGGVAKSVGAGDEVRFNANQFVITID
jgi:hypothetical protein